MLGSPTRLGRNILQDGASGYNLGFNCSLLQNNSISSEYLLINFQYMNLLPYMTILHAQSKTNDGYFILEVEGM